MIAILQSFLFSLSTNFKMFCHLSVFLFPELTSSFSKTFSYFSHSRSFKISSFSLRNQNKIKTKKDNNQKREFHPPKIISKNDEHSGQYGFVIKLVNQFENASLQESPQESNPWGGLKIEYPSDIAVKPSPAME